MSSQISTLYLDNHLKNSLPKRWAVICIINLLLTALIGLSMRYKIVFPFPVMNQTNALHAHANFVFSGWVGLVLFSSIVAFVLSETQAGKRIYRIAFCALEIASLGMLVSYMIQGYGFVSVCFTLLAAAAGCLFIFHIWRDLKYAQKPESVRLFLKGAMLWYLVSILGTIALIYLDFFGKGDPIDIRSTFYFFLHFQYNGWFTFCIFGLLLSWLYAIHQPLKSPMVNIVFWLLFVGLIPGYFLSVLVYYPHLWIEISAIISVFTYFLAAILLFLIIIKTYPHLRKSTPKSTSILWKIATLAFFLKTILQAATLMPSLASFAFSFRPLIIGFLHLTFLCFVTFFLIGYLLYFKQYQIRRFWPSKVGLVLFVVSVILSEIALFAQSFLAFIGIYAFIFQRITFWITAGIFLGLILFVLGQFKKAKKKMQISASE